MSQAEDAVPKKRGPKTDVLEALLKRVDGLEAKLKEKKERPTTPTSEDAPPPVDEAPSSSTVTVTAKESSGDDGETKSRSDVDTTRVVDVADSVVYTPSTSSAPSPPGVQPDALLDTYFSRFHAKPYYILDESSVRQRLQLNQLPSYLVHAIYAVAARYTPHPSGYQSAVRLSEDYASRARLEIDLDEPSIDALQACLLLVTAFTAAGKGKKAYMLLTNAVGMAMAQELHREMDPRKKSQGSSGMLIDISRILGITNRYLAAGGVKGDSHFPWHTLSNLSKIRQDLDIWASGIEDVFSSLDTLFGQTDSTVLVLSKLIYHLIHCLIYRPFLPIDLAELAGNGQHQSWQIEATNMCFLHANAIAELVELGKQTATIEWPAFVGYCICTAGTVHIHGAYYSKAAPGGEMSVFSSSAEFLSREMQQLSELRYAWASVQHQRETLQSIYNAHSELVKSLANMRYSPVFQLEDFFDRYSNIGGPGGQSFNFDAANLSLSDVVVDFTTDAYTGHDLYAPRAGISDHHPHMNGMHDSDEMANNAAMAAAAAAGFSIPQHPHHPPPPQSQVNPFSPPYTSYGHMPNSTPGPGPSSPPPPPNHNTSTTTTNNNNNHHNNSGGPSFDPMFGGLPTNAFSSPAAWHGNGGTPGPAGAGLVHSPGGLSTSGSTGTAPGEEKDPFLSLLEQLAENENARGPGSEFDMFFSGACQQ
ncbi:hypothetical protein VSDG_06935 [Cytospora chrysosperma]|uniref:Xylanolytic transcriptional activator regulatory domain-containing protein n=1 Tax=Cytospora chrysosperma TaxID=252740 RepID=A0A423VRV1_CYTCH|nr:hypothetical protein VSDG_06935 [Valsa sordida]